jgi:hypothetical protein
VIKTAFGKSDVAESSGKFGKLLSECKQKKVKCAALSEKFSSRRGKPKRICRGKQLEKGQTADWKILCAQLIKTTLISAFDETMELELAKKVQV